MILTQQNQETHTVYTLLWHRDTGVSTPRPSPFPLLSIKPNPRQRNTAVWVFHAKHFIETNNSRERDKLRGVIGKRENIRFQLQFKMKCSVDETENTAGRLLGQKRPRRARTS